MQPEQLLQQIHQFADARAKGETCRALSNLITDHAERAHMRARAEYWESQRSHQHDALTVTINSMLPPTIYAEPDPTGPVWLTGERDLEVRGTIHTSGRRICLRLTPEQAIAIAATLIACAAVSVDRSGTGLATILPPLPPTTKSDTTA